MTNTEQRQNQQNKRKPLRYSSPRELIARIIANYKHSSQVNLCIKNCQSIKHEVLQRRNTNGQQIIGKVLRSFSQQRNTNRDAFEIMSYPRMALIKKVNDSKLSRGCACRTARILFTAGESSHLGDHHQISVQVAQKAKVSLPCDALLLVTQNFQVIFHTHICCCFVHSC